MPESLQPGKTEVWISRDNNATIDPNCPSKTHRIFGCVQGHRFLDTIRQELISWAGHYMTSGDLIIRPDGECFEFKTVKALKNGVEIVSPNFEFIGHRFGVASPSKLIRETIVIAPTDVGCEDFSPGDIVIYTLSEFQNDGHLESGGGEVLQAFLDTPKVQSIQIEVAGQSHLSGFTYLYEKIHSGDYA